MDVAWHEFILFTRGYQAFCGRVIGRFLHHTPAEHMASGEVARQGLRRTWRHACRLEGIGPGNPDRPPRLFAIDVLLAIPDGFRYDLDCARKDGTAGGAMRIRSARRASAAAGRGAVATVTLRTGGRRRRRRRRLRRRLRLPARSSQGRALGAYRKRSSIFLLSGSRA